MKLHHLIYFSEALDMTPDQLHSIETTSSTNNARDDITGLLIYSDDWFFQVLEGHRSQVSTTLRRVMLDERHRGVTICLSEDIDQRHFRAVPMKMVNREDASKSPHFQMIDAPGFHPRDIAGHLIWEACMDVAERQGLIEWHG